jgi:hypothetical protein
MRNVERETHRADKSPWQKGHITVSTKLLMDGFDEFSSSLAQITNAAKSELGAFLYTVRQVFGQDEVEHAADLWIACFEADDWIDFEREQVCRRVTIHALAQLVESRSLMATAAGGSKSPSKLDWSREGC